ncbi:MAG: hypothetical protein A3J38_01290 [Gammaproteobacteria bacterium RIFCSPHIGHO2_12_FULL_45_9]|nr:MAG: hypothetical protein A3J38_01290 [Gammaproteobacteria bacterium RIFCSPHIGHO2_12_FULL_45_9]
MLERRNQNQSVLRMKDVCWCLFGVSVVTSPFFASLGLAISFTLDAKHIVKDDPECFGLGTSGAGHHPGQEGQNACVKEDDAHGDEKNQYCAFNETYWTPYQTFPASCEPICFDYWEACEKVLPAWITFGVIGGMTFLCCGYVAWKKERTEDEMFRNALDTSLIERRNAAVRRQVVSPLVRGSIMTTYATNPQDGVDASEQPPYQPPVVSH